MAPPWSGTEMIKTIADPTVLNALVEHLGALRANSGRRWGTLTPNEMLCHLGDAFEMVLRIRPRIVPISRRRRKHAAYWIGLWSPLPFPRDFPTNPEHNPRDQGTRPTDFDRDRARVVAALRGLAAPSGGLEPIHGAFGPMSRRDWQRWAYKHADHHLRQFGL